jgi:hypothetical protein
VPTRLSSASTGSDDALPSAEAEPVEPATEAEPVPPSAEAVPLRFAPRPAPPATPRNLAAKGTGSREIALSWAPLDATSGIGSLAFVIERCVGEAGACLTRLAVIAKVDGKATTFVDSALHPGTAYTYRIFAVNEAGKSEPTAPVTALTLGPDSPSSLPVPASPATSGPRT